MITGLENLTFKIGKGLQTWDEIYDKDLKAQANLKSNVVALTHTARNIGQINVEILWYIPSQSSHEYTAKRFESHSTIEEVTNQAAQYLNEFVAPHMLNSISIFEEDHPNA
jgi:hypothetical protein